MKRKSPRRHDAALMWRPSMTQKHTCMFLKRRWSMLLSPCVSATATHYTSGIERLIDRMAIVKLICRELALQKAIQAHGSTQSVHVYSRPLLPLKSACQMPTLVLVQITVLNSKSNACKVPAIASKIQVVALMSKA